ncbi:hypothetical protein CYY_001697 [Polysphondylium violaceum]|uniref:pantothenate kinase n=1 Tax=Polysphondylium violaceum TaxID=133409 RepID=A0A8J4PZD4_9MYCE|nr:hypothetical protein CYY_001697 [Polysphondylium violaceum]
MINLRGACMINDDNTPPLQSVNQIKPRQISTSSEDNRSRSISGSEQGVPIMIERSNSHVENLSSSSSSSSSSSPLSTSPTTQSSSDKQPINIDNLSDSLLKTNLNSSSSSSTSTTTTTVAPTTNNNININTNTNTNTPSSSPPKYSPKDRPISLPNQTSPIKHFALDIGGTLAKLVYFVQNKHSKNRHNEMGGRLHFIKFQTANIEDCFNFILENNLHIDEGKPKVVRVTGGGAYKYADLFEKRLGCKLVKEDEMQCLIWGTNFLLNNIQKESFTYSPLPNCPSPKEFVDKVENPYPYLLVQIGSGVSIIKVDSETSYQRVDGTSLGGGTFWGLCSLLTGVTDYDEMLELTKHGQSNAVDLVVGDIYGTDYTKVGLSSDTIASSFGKIIYKNASEKQPYRREDIAQSLLKMVANNIGQIAYLNSQRYGLNKIYFGGFFIRDHPNTMQRISFAIDFWSKGKTKAMFLVHDGYLGSLGAFLAPDEIVGSANSNSGNSNSSGGVDNSTNWWKRTTRELSKIFNNNNNNNLNSNSNNNSENNSNNNHNSNHHQQQYHHSIDNSSNNDLDCECDCGCEFCEGLVCKVDLKSS